MRTALSSPLFYNERRLNMQSIANFMTGKFHYLSMIGFWDIVDIIIVAYIIYKIIDLIRKTSSYSIARGLLVLLVVLWLSSALKLTMINWLIKKAVDIGIIAIVILFQPEIRKFLSKVGNRGFTGFIPKKSQLTSELEGVINQTVLACTQLAATKTGALIIFERDYKLNDIMATGTIINADVTSELLKNIFYPKAPLHDGALIIRDCRVASAGCVLPLTNNSNLSKDLGMRHRAGIGASEQSDALVVIVSEETGAISVATEGMLKRNLNRDTFEKILRKELVEEEISTQAGENLIEQIRAKLKVNDNEAGKNN